MALNKYPSVFNTSVRFRQSLGMEEKEVVSFFTEVMKSMPDFQNYRRTEDDFHLYQEVAGSPVRQLLVRDKGITLAVASSISPADAEAIARSVYSLISQHLHPSLLVIELIDVSFRFTFRHKGNQDLLVLSGLFGETPYAAIATGIEGAVRDFQPRLGLSLDADHSTVAVLDITTGTTVGEIETGNFGARDIRVECGVAKTKGLTQQDMATTFAVLFRDATRFIEERVAPLLLDRLSQAVIGDAQ